MKTDQSSFPKVVWCSYSTISSYHEVQVLFAISSDHFLQWNRMSGVSQDYLVVLSSLVDINRGYVFEEKGRITWSDTWRGISGSNVSFQRPALKH